jgi:1-acyl-sn-glycerol-3-phosphate acyltransferase
MKAGKRGYSSVKPYSKRVKKHPFIKLFAWFIRLFIKKAEIILTEPLPEDEGVIIVSNHAIDFGPKVFLTSYNRAARHWADSALCYTKYVHDHCMLYFFPDAKGIGKFLAHIAAFLLSFILPPIFRGLEVIPVYRSTKLVTTFVKSAETIAEKKDVIIFPETEVRNPAYTYVNNMNNGFIRVANYCYRATGRVVKFYPAYACKALNKLLIGHPVTINPDISEKSQLKEFKTKISDEIERLALSLPEHKITPFNLTVDRPEFLKEELLRKYGNSEKYSYKDLRKQYLIEKEKENQLKQNITKESENDS